MDDDIARNATTTEKSRIIVTVGLFKMKLKLVKNELRSFFFESCVQKGDKERERRE